MPATRVISFDLDDTIWECGPVLRRANEAQADFLRQHWPDTLGRSYTGSAFRELCGTVMEANPSRSFDLTWARKAALGELARSHGLDPAAVVEPTFDAFIAARNRVQEFIYPGVLPLLRRLRERGFTLVSNTNGNADVSRIPELAALFEFSVTAESAGAAKPAAAPFLAVLEHCGVKASECLHVGDSVTSDVQGAQAAGVRAVWVRGTAKHDAPEGCTTIDACADLEAALEAMGCFPKI